MSVDFISKIIEAAGVPKEAARKELSRIINSMGKTESDITLDELRVVLANYLQDVLLEAKNELTK